MRNILIFIKWLFYASITMNERRAWMESQERGCYCQVSGGYVKVFPGIAPQRDYVTYKEFMQLYKNPK